MSVNMDNVAYISKEKAESMDLHKVYTAETGEKISDNLNVLIKTIDNIKEQAVTLNALIESTDQLIKNNSSYLAVSDR